MPQTFVEQLQGIRKVGSLFFLEAVADEAKSRVDWTICAVVDPTVVAPSGLSLREIAASPALFAICPAAEDTSACTEAAIGNVSAKLVHAQDVDQLKAALPRAIKSGDTVTNRTAAVKLLIRYDGDLIPLLYESVAVKDSGAVLSGLKDATIRRSLLTQPSAPATPATYRSSVIAIAVAPALRDALQTAMATVK